MSTPRFTAISAVDGAPIDGSWFTAVTDFARATSGVNGAVYAYSTFGTGLFVVLIVSAWWAARRAGPAAMTVALGVGIAAIVAYGVSAAVKIVVAEPRPCFVYPRAFLLEPCPGPSDYAFPSNHTTVAAAMTAALFLVHRRLGLLGLLATLLMGLSRVYVGAHYPHDVVGGLLLGAGVGLGTALVLRRFATPLIGVLRAGPLHPLVVAGGPVTAHHLAGPPTDRS